MMIINRVVGLSLILALFYVHFIFKDFPTAAAYANKFIDHWDDICVLVGPDRAIGDGGEHFAEGADMMDNEACEGGSSSVDTTSSNSRKKQKHDQLADAVSSFAHCFQTYVDSRINTTVSGKEVRDVVSKVHGILPFQVLRAVKILMKCPEEFKMLKDFPEEEKLDWILLFLDEGSY